MFLFAQKNAILLVWPFEELSIQPELLSPSCFRIQGGPGGGGYPERDIHTYTAGAGQDSFFLILDVYLAVESFMDIL